MPKYRKKPVVIEAMQAKWGMTFIEIANFTGIENIFHKPNGDLFIRTLEGDMKVSPNDYIIKGIHGEFYPCKPDIFNETYEEVRTDGQEGL